MAGGEAAVLPLRTVAVRNPARAFHDDRQVGWGAMLVVDPERDFPFTRATVVTPRGPREDRHAGPPPTTPIEIALPE